MASKLESFLTDKKIDHRRLLSASKQEEKLRTSDRRVKLTLRNALRKEDGKRPEGLPERRSGRPVTTLTLGKALAGTKISGPARTRILRAVNRLLVQRKQSAVTLDTIFDVPKAGAPKAKPEPAAEEAASAEA